MNHRSGRLAQTAAAVILFSALAVGTPIVNAEASPPRSVFLVLPDDLPQPVVAVSARRLPSGKWRVAVDVANFRFTDLCLTTAEAIPVGHAHVIVDGVKVASAYQPFVDVDLPPGARHVAVVLRGQDHRALFGRDGLIRSEVVVAVPET